MRTHRHLFAYLLVVIAAAVGFWKLTSVANKANEAAKLAKARSDDQARTIRFLCDTVYVVDDMASAMLTLIRKAPPNERRREFLNTIESDHVQIVDRLTEENSPCAS